MFKYVYNQIQQYNITKKGIGDKNTYVLKAELPHKHNKNSAFTIKFYKNKTPEL